MKKIILIFTILSLIIITTITKNSTRELENQIFLTMENLSVLKKKYELVLLDYNYLSSPKKLMEYQSTFFQDDLIKIDINNIKKIIKKKDELIILKFNTTKDKIEE